MVVEVGDVLVDSGIIGTTTVSVSTLGLLLKKFKKLLVTERITLSAIEVATSVAVIGIDEVAIVSD